MKVTVAQLTKIAGGVTEFGAAGGPLAIRSIIAQPHKAAALISELGSIALGGTGSVVGGDVGESKC